MLQVLHTLAFNTYGAVHDQLAGSRVIKALSNQVARPAFAGLDVAVAQLLVDFAWLYGCVCMRLGGSVGLHCSG